MKKRWFAFVTFAAGGGLLGLQACGDDVVSMGTPDASVDSPASIPDGAPLPTPDASEASAPNGGVVSFTVPASGGSVDVPSAAGKLTFVFPASAAGKSLTFKQGSAGAVGGLTAGSFLDVISMGPDGARFSDPVLVKVEKKALVGAMLTFTESGAKGSPSALPFDKPLGGYQLRHFTALVIVPIGKVCDSEGYSDTPDSGRCSAAGSASTFRTIGCKGYSYCTLSAGACCIDPAVDSGTGCTVEQQIYSVTYSPTDSNGGQYPYCDSDAGDWDGGDAGCTGVSFGLGYAANGGCYAGRSCPGALYEMSCNGTMCTCSVAGTPTSTFAQAVTSCDTGVTMQNAFIQRCNFPAH